MGTPSSQPLAHWLIPGQILFLVIHLLGVSCFVFIVVRRVAPLRRGERDFRFDRPLSRLARVLRFWLGQWKQPRFRMAGTIHILIFAGFLVLAIHTFSLLIFGMSLVPPGFSGKAGHLYDVITDYAASVVFMAVTIAAIRRLFFKPARYAVPARYGKGHPADAIFLLALIGILMLADSLFEAS